MKMPSSRMLNSPIAKYIGSDFDNVITIVQNLELIREASKTLESVNILMDSFESILESEKNTKEYSEQAKSSETYVKEYMDTVVDKTNQVIESAKIVKEYSANAFKNGGIFTPTYLNQYPDTTLAITPMLYLINLSDTKFFNFTEGNLKGLTIFSGDQLYYDSINDSFELIRVTNVQQFFDLVFPIGHILTTFNTKNPSTYGYMGTWVKLEDDVILSSGNPTENSIGSNEIEVPVPYHTHSANTTYGGSHSHTIPAFTGQASGTLTNTASYSDTNTSITQDSGLSGNHNHDVTIEYSGIENVTIDVRGKRYLVVMWKRIA